MSRKYKAHCFEWKISLSENDNLHTLSKTLADKPGGVICADHRLQALSVTPLRYVVHVGRCISCKICANV